MDTNRRWVVIGFVFLAVVCAWTFGKGYAYLFYYLKKFNVRDIEILGSAFLTSDLLGVATSAGLAWFFWSKEDINVAGHEVVEELRKVTWPEQEDVKNSTVVVIISTILFALVFATFDMVWKWVTDFIYS